MSLLDRIERRLKAVKLSATAASKSAGLGEDAIRNLRRAVKKNPAAGMGQETLIALAPVLETTVAWLVGEEGPEVVATGAKLSAAEIPVPVARHDLDIAEPLAAVPSDLLRNGPRNLPVLGTAAGSSVIDKGGFEVEARVIEYRSRPPALATVVDAYAIYITGDSMWPEHKNGDLRVVHPRKPPRIGDSVVVQVKYGPEEPIVAFVGTLAKRAADRVVISKHNPKAEVEFDSSFVVAIHPMLTQDELIG